MWDFSGDEWLFFFAALAMGVGGAVRWAAMLSLRRFVPSSFCLSIVLTAFLSLTVIYLVLISIADQQTVVGHFDYVVLFLIGGAAWIIAGTSVLNYLGLESLSDLLERRNAASLVMNLGAMLGIALTYAGSNIGGGPTIWTTLIPAAAAAVALFALAGLLELFTDTADAITIDRDVACAARTGAMWVANGAILGRAMGGDWHGFDELWSTFLRLGWPTIAITLGLAILHRFARPTPARPQPDVVKWGVWPSAFLIVGTTIYLVALGRPR